MAMMQREMTHRVRRALDVLDMADKASEIVDALSARGLVVVQREDLVDERWLQERLAAVREGAHNGKQDDPAPAQVLDEAGAS